ncbi:hypothetical protein LMG28727_03442 [Paraburkholderia kirstenboschensis]|uniref:hypothetical protein n=1 Tax=Paraburkholderia kirstenboschensis TaxID=1245436 RepID=UPI00191AD41F|nr:hypothetical protein [Paraburkholderia kirstenboschensis]CAD6537325.1 hypothetical protein LMG28727_03442 [Paraburkholderia kirstenboschensis]
MKPFCVAATAVVAAAVTMPLGGCSSAWPPPAQPVAQHVSPANETRASPAYQGAKPAAPTAPATRPPALSVGVTDPNTQLILPWFLADIVNAVNTRQSFGDLMHTMKNGL